VVDRVTILRIKAARLQGAGALANVRRELDALESSWRDAGLPDMPALDQWPALQRVNTALWEVEDALRSLEARRSFGPAFVAHARSVYRLNDERAALKRAINLQLGSRLVEEKSYAGAPD
jgi:hypothetical protein